MKFLDIMWNIFAKLFIGMIISIVVCFGIITEAYMMLIGFLIATVFSIIITHIY
jgi:hypothetical protein